MNRGSESGFAKKVKLFNKKKKKKEEEEEKEPWYSKWRNPWAYFRLTLNFHLRKGNSARFPMEEGKT
jgi:hypothetical protein